MLEAGLSCLLSNGQEDVFDNSVEQESPLLQEEGPKGVWVGWNLGGGGLFSFFPKESKSFAASTKGVAPQSLRVLIQGVV